MGPFHAGELLPRYVARRVDEIEATKSDFEAAHALEDKLFEEFVTYIANADTAVLAIHVLQGDVQAAAKMVLKSKEIDFARVCA